MGKNFQHHSYPSKITVCILRIHLSSGRAHLSLKDFMRFTTSAMLERKYSSKTQDYCIRNYLKAHVKLKFNSPKT